MDSAAAARTAETGTSRPQEGTLSPEPAVTMQDPELEHAELLPARETLWSTGGHPGCSVTNAACNTSQAGLVNVSAFNGEGNSLNVLNNILSL